MTPHRQDSRLPIWWLRLCQDDHYAETVAAVGGAAAVALWAAVIFQFGATPAEDAFILFRYADHWAAGHGIVWNVGEKPVEGATDFLWLALIALGTRLTRDPVVVSFSVGGLFIASTVAIVWIAARQLLRLPFVAVTAATLSYLATPAAIHVVNGFSPPMFACLLLFETLCLLLLLLNHDESRLRWALASGMLLVGLTRPEGNAFNLAVLVVYVAASRRTSQAVWKQSIVPVLLLYVLPGMAYFLARWSYFGLPWPLPFLVKGLGHDPRARVIVANLADLAMKQGVVVALVAIALLRKIGDRPEGRAVAISALPAGVLLISYLPFVQSQNVLNRFQFPPVAVLLTLLAVRAGFQARELDFRSARLSAGLLAAATAWSAVSVVPIPEPRMETIPLGRALGALSDRSLTLATTEAGRLPYYSRWRTLDSYGLNDPSVATAGLTYDHWLKYAPDLVLIHPPRSWNPYTQAVPSDGGSHQREMMEHMRRDGTYELVAVVRRRGRIRRVHADDYHLYFVSRESPEWGALERQVLSIPGAVYAPRSRMIERYLQME